MVSLCFGFIGILLAFRWITTMENGQKLAKPRGSWELQPRPFRQTSKPSVLNANNAKAQELLPMSSQQPCASGESPVIAINSKIKNRRRRQRERRSLKSKSKPSQNLGQAEERQEMGRGQLPKQTVQLQPRPFRQTPKPSVLNAYINANGQELLPMSSEQPCPSGASTLPAEGINSKIKNRRRRQRERRSLKSKSKPSQDLGQAEERQEMGRGQLPKQTVQLQPRPFRQTPKPRVFNAYINANNAQKLLPMSSEQPCPSGASTLPVEATNSRIKNRRRRQRERRSLKSKFKPSQELGQAEERQETGSDQLPKQAANEIGYGQDTGENQGAQP